MTRCRHRSKPGPSKQLVSKKAVTTSLGNVDRGQLDKEKEKTAQGRVTWVTVSPSESEVALSKSKTSRKRCWGHALICTEGQEGSTRLTQPPGLLRRPCLPKETAGWPPSPLYNPGPWVFHPLLMCGYCLPSLSKLIAAN